jgi:hypothetical protein
MLSLSYVTPYDGVTFTTASTDTQCEAKTSIHKTITSQTCDKLGHYANDCPTMNDPHDTGTQLLMAPAANDDWRDSNDVLFIFMTSGVTQNTNGNIYHPPEFY